MRAWHALAAVCLFWAVVYLPGLGSPELKGEEGRRILPGRTMLESGEWVVPFIGGEPYHRKPPLVNWLAAGSFALFGRQDEWTARAPSALFVLLFAVGATGLTSRWLGANGGLIAGLAAILNPALIDKGRLAEIEAVYVPLTGIAFAVWTTFHLGRSGHGTGWLKYGLPSIALGLGFLAKGPVHLLFFYAPVIAVLTFSGRLRELLGLPHLASLAITFGPFLTWASIARRRVAALAPNDETPDAVWIRQLTSRLDFEQFDLGNWLKTPFEGALNFAPWVVLLAVLWWWLARRKRWLPAPDFAGERGRSWARGTAWGTGAAFLAVALAPQTEARYAHPAVGAAALLFAWMVVALEQSQDARDVSLRECVARWWKRANGGMVISVVVAAAAAPFILRIRFPDAFGLIPTAIGLVGAGGLWFGARKLGRESCFTSRAIVTAMAIAGGVWIYVLHGIPVMNGRDNVRNVGRAISAELPEGSRLCVLDPGIQPFLFYLQPPYAVVDRASRIPSDTTHLLATDRVLGKVAEVRRFQGFAFAEVARFPDPRSGQDQVLLRAQAQAP